MAKIDKLVKFVKALIQPRSRPKEWCNRQPRIRWTATVNLRHDLAETLTLTKDQNDNR